MSSVGMEHGMMEGFDLEIVFVTNYYNHHQAALAECFDVQSEHHFHFIETAPITDERKNMGWSNAGAPDYVKKAYENDQSRTECQELINRADVVIWGSCPFDMIKPRLRAKKLTFCYSERLFKKGFGPVAFGGRAIKYWLKHWRYQKNHYLLCASAYAAADYAKIGLFRTRAYKWGYFPERKDNKSVQEIINVKKQESILWAGRMIGWKHPEVPVLVAKRLKDTGLCFRLDMIGNGEQMSSVNKLKDELGLQDCVHLHGVKTPDEVRRYMEETDIYLFTSDQNEGWGAVVNEAMSSACAVVASDAAGSVQYLVENEKNGLVYCNGNLEALYQNVVLLLENPERSRLYGRCAYETMTNEWSAEQAAKRFIELVQSLVDGKRCDYAQGPCSEAR